MDKLTIMRLSRFAVALFTRFPKLFVINVFLALVLTFVDALSIFSVAPIVSLIQEGSPSDQISVYMYSAVEWIGLPTSLEFFLAVFVVLSILRVVMRGCIQYYIINVKYIVDREILSDITNKVLDASMNFVKSQRQGDFVNAMTTELAKVSSGFTALARIIAPVIQISILIVIPFYISWSTTIISIVTLLILSMPLALLNKYTYKFGRRTTFTGNQHNVVLQETFSQLRLIAGFGNKSITIQRIGKSFGENVKAIVCLEGVGILIQSAYGPIGIVTVLVTFLVARDSGIPASQIIVMVYAFYRLATSVSELAGYKKTLLSVYPGYEYIMRLGKLASKSKIKVGSVPFLRLNKDIKLENVNFFYPSSSEEGKPFHALKDININIPVGKVVALVGASGSGKSTLIDIVMGLQECEKGSVLFDGVLISELNHEELHQKIGYVPQVNELFHDSIKNNLLWGNPEASEEQIRTSCKSAYAHDFIMELDKGYDTIVGDKGAKLSGGQVQRIALARALIRNPEILILDEATSALDTYSEKHIQLAISGISSQTTILVIAHRLSTISNADYIYVFDRGRIIEEGTYKELIDIDAGFANLVNLQKL